VCVLHRAHTNPVQNTKEPLASPSCFCGGGGCVQVVEDCVYSQARWGVQQYLAATLAPEDAFSLRAKCTRLLDKDQSFFSIPAAVQSSDDWCVCFAPPALLATAARS
jgi:hypothetical protein